MKNKKLVIVSGMSGSGKSHTMNVLEDSGYFCVDNLPVELVHKFIDLFNHTKREKFAVVLDVRSAENVNDLRKAYKMISLMKGKLTVVKLFLDSDDRTLIKRFSETRRKHPLGGNLVEAIRRERELLTWFKKDADYVIDSSNLILSELKREVLKVINERNENKVSVTIMSFGYRYGIPINADIVFDTRFLPNPNYDEKLKKYTGKNKKIKSFLLSFDTTKKFIFILKNFLEFVLPQVFLEGKNYLTIAFGCTGGQHRSVFLAEFFYNYIKTSTKLKKYNFEVIINHRDVAYYE